MNAVRKNIIKLLGTSLKVKKNLNGYSMLEKLAEIIFTGSFPF